MTMVHLPLPADVRKVGCLGLSANPPDKGHLMVAHDVLASGLVDSVLLIPVFQHAFADEDPAKKDMAPWEDRVAMLRLLVEGEEHVRVCTIEQELGGVSYTCKTLDALQKRYPACKFRWIVGGDAIQSGAFRRWKNWEQLKHKAKFIAVPRLGHWFYDKSLPRCFKVLPPRPIRDMWYEEMLSSTRVREMIANGEDITKAVGEKVAQYIYKRGLYQTKED